LPGNRVFYLALPPLAFVAAVESLGTIGLNEGPGWTRIVCEKPFGHDHDSAVELNRRIHRYFDESQTYRIDHYLGKETVRNLLAFRFANTIFESVWNRQHVGSVEIIVAESIGVDGRGEFYDQTGAFRDMVQNHLSQLLTLTAMEVPPSLDADAIRDEKVKVLRSVSPISPDDIELGQYAEGLVDEQPVEGYLDESGVAPGSTTETFVAMRVNVANSRWQGVPFLLRTGKRMPERTTQIAINFRCPVLAMFQARESAEVHANALVLTLQPDEGFDLRFEVKLPGEGLRLQTQSLSFKYADVFERLPEAYETLLLDVITGDQTLFVRADEVEESWRLYAPLLEALPAPNPYAAGTLGPSQASRLMVPRGASCPI
jgi:glucose-6-phosphate 1-dehydrogenase